jgi:hypothetical protein
MAGTNLPNVPSIADMAAAIADQRSRIESDEDLARELKVGRPSGNPITLGPRLPNPAEWAKLQIQGAQNNAAKWLDRTTHPKKNFREEALKPSTAVRYHDSMQRVLAEKTWEGGMALVNESEAMATIVKRGSAAYSQGVADREPKITRVVQEMYDDRLALATTIDNLPEGTEAEREAKMLANKRGLQAIGAKRRGAK